MNLRHVFNLLGILLAVLSGVLLVMAAGFFGYVAVRDTPIDVAARTSFLIAGGSGLVIAGLMWFFTRKGPRHIGRREALLLVGTSWVLGAAFCALPFFFWAHMHEGLDRAHPFLKFIDCYFEAMSGLTTTGATVLGDTPNDIESLPRSLLLWRALTHWLGGLGIVVLFVAVLPSLGVGGKKLYRVEAPGPTSGGVQPQIRQTARVLWLIYLGLTFAEIIALRIAGMGWFDSICHTFSTIATAGFSTKNASLGAYDSGAITIIIIAFMVLGGVNFGLFYQLIRRRFSAVWRDTELRLYLILLIAGSAVVVYALVDAQTPIELTRAGEAVPATVGNAIKHGVFTTVSIQTTTGFASADFNAWPFLAQAVLIMFMFIGGSAGSTAGGIKVIRIWVAFKVMYAEIERVFRPNVVRPVKIGRNAIDPDLKLSVIAYVLGILILFALGSGVIMVIEQANPASDCDYTSAAAASLATLCTIGPGLSQVGAVENYGWFSGASKGVLCMLMALGRLEVFAILVLFTPRFWRGD